MQEISSNLESNLNNSRTYLDKHRHRGKYLLHVHQLAHLANRKIGVTIEQATKKLG